MRNNPDDLSNQLINKIKKYLKSEVKCNGKHPWHDGEEMIEDDGGDICVGRAELAENLLTQIKIWEDKLYD